jgi:hypothetical protein
VEIHVSGHQNKTTNIENLSIPEKPSVFADIEAKTALQEHHQDNKYHQLPSVKAMLYIQGRPVTSKEMETL